MGPRNLAFAWHVCNFSSMKHPSTKYSSHLEFRKEVKELFKRKCARDRCYRGRRAGEAGRLSPLKKSLSRRIFSIELCLDSPARARPRPRRMRGCTDISDLASSPHECRALTAPCNLCALPKFLNAIFIRSVGRVRSSGNSNRPMGST